MSGHMQQTVSHEVSGHAPEGEQLALRMRTAVVGAVEPGPDFLRGAIDADAMAKHMVAAVQGFQGQNEQQIQRLVDGRIAATPELVELWQALGELYGCGSGYLADRCDADCVARTMTQMVREFPPEAAG